MVNFSILIIDDDKELLVSLKNIFQAHKYNIDTAENGQEGLEKVKMNKYNIVLLDLHLPDIEGFEIFDSIKFLQPETIIFLMTETSQDDLEKLRVHGISTLITKPIKPDKIIPLIEKLEKKSTILIVDDNENDRNLLSEIIQENGYNVLTAKTGAEAIQYTRSKSFDLVVLDIRLPDMDGIKVMEQIKEYNTAVTIIAITGHSLDGIIDKIVNKGAYSCLLKPFDINLLLSEIQYVFQRKTEITKIEQRDISIARILLVEDNDGLRETLKDILESEGFIVDTASSVSEAKNKIENQYFNMVISDLSLNNESGLSLVDVVRKKDKFTIFLLITGFGTMETALEAMKKDVDEYILKPVKPIDLIRKVKTHLDKQRLNKEKEELVQRLKESNTKLLELSKTDELTGVYNRRTLFEELHEEMQRARRQRKTLSIFMCDIDGFKKYNDTYGHLEGDILLKEISSVLLNSIRLHVDKVFRYGGDEFVIVVPEVSESDSINIANRIIEKVKSKFAHKNISISIGISHFKSDVYEMGLNEFIDLADKRLYEAKRQGKGKAVFSN